jgi:transposase
MSRSVGLFAVLGFETTHDAVAAERALLDAGVPVLLIPTPKILGTLCGLAARVEQSDRPRARSVLEKAGIIVSGEAHIEDRIA